MTEHEQENQKQKQKQQVDISPSPLYEENLVTIATLSWDNFLIWELPRCTCEPLKRKGCGNDITLVGQQVRTYYPRSRYIPLDAFEQEVAARRKQLGRNGKEGIDR